MKRTINEHDFIDAFQGTYKDQFSYEGKIALYEYLTQLEEDTGFEMELDAIGICCEYTEYDEFTELFISCWYFVEWDAFISSHVLRHS